MQIITHQLFFTSLGPELSNLIFLVQWLSYQTDLNIYYKEGRLKSVTKKAKAAHRTRKNTLKIIVFFEKHYMEDILKWKSNNNKIMTLPRITSILKKVFLIVLCTLLDISQVKHTSKRIWRFYGLEAPTLGLWLLVV